MLNSASSGRAKLIVSMSSRFMICMRESPRSGPSLSTTFMLSEMSTTKITRLEITVP